MISFRYVPRMFLLYKDLNFETLISKEIVSHALGIHYGQYFEHASTTVDEVSC